MTEKEIDKKELKLILKEKFNRDFFNSVLTASFIALITFTIFYSVLSANIQNECNIFIAENYLSDKVYYDEELNAFIPINNYNDSLNLPFDFNFNNSNIKIENVTTDGLIRE